MKSLGYPNLTSFDVIDQYAANMIDLLDAAVTSTLPPAKPLARPPDLRKSADVKTAFDNAQDALKVYIFEAASERSYTLVHYMRLQARAETLLAGAKRRSFRRYVSEEGKTSRGAFGGARLSTKICQPKAVPHLKCFVVNDISYETTSAMSQIYRDHLWADTHDTIATPIPQPPIDPQREQFTCSKELLDNEVTRLITKLKRGKAPGGDGVANRLLKLSKETIVPYL